MGTLAHSVKVGAILFSGALICFATQLRANTADSALIGVNQGTISFEVATNVPALRSTENRARLPPALVLIRGRMGSCSNRWKRRCPFEASKLVWLCATITCANTYLRPPRGKFRRAFLERTSRMLEKRIGPTGDLLCNRCAGNSRRESAVCDDADHH